MDNLSKNDVPNKKLYEGVMDGDIKLVKSAISKGADINTMYDEGKNSALMLALERNQNEIAKYLVSKGTDVNAKNSGWTCLMIAAFFGNEEIVKLLLSKGADMAVKNYANETALSWAEKNSHPKIAELLKKHGAK